MAGHDLNSTTEVSTRTSGPGPGPATTTDRALSARAGHEERTVAQHALPRETPAVRTNRQVGTSARTHLRARHPRAARRPARCGRFDEHEVVLPVVVITELEGKRHHPELGYFARSALRLLDELRVQHGRLDQPVPIGDARRHAARRAQPHRPRVAAGRLPAGRQRHPHPRGRPQPRRRGLRRSRWSRKDLPMRVKASAVGPRRRGVPRRARRRVRLDRHGRARRHREQTSTSCTRTGRSTSTRRRELPCHTGLVLLSERGSGLGRVGADKQVRLVRGDRDAFGLHGRSRRAADRPRPAARPRHRHRLARRPRRHRQVRAGAVRRARGGDGAPPAPQGRRLPAAVRRRRPGARLPARQRVREDEPLGAGGVRHPRRARHAATSSRRSSTAACSRCCR